MIKLPDEFFLASQIQLFALNSALAELVLDELSNADPQKRSELRTKLNNLTESKREHLQKLSIAVLQKHGDSPDSLLDALSNYSNNK